MPWFFHSTRLSYICLLTCNIQNFLWSKILVNKGEAKYCTNNILFYPMLISLVMYVHVSYYCYTSTNLLKIKWSLICRIMLFWNIKDSVKPKILYFKTLFLNIRDILQGSLNAYLQCISKEFHDQHTINPCCKCNKAKMSIMQLHFFMHT